MFTEAIGRKPSDKESNLMSDLFREQKENFSKDKESAKNYLSIGDKAYDPNIPVEDIAALGVLATAIFNLWKVWQSSKALTLPRLILWRVNL